MNDVSPVPRLLLADDSLSDGMLLRLGFADARRSVEIVQAIDGPQAFEFARAAIGTGPFPFRLILIDLNLPKMSGLELLDSLHELPGLDNVPKVILTSSTNPKDRLSSLERKPTAFLTKPDDYPGVHGVVSALVPYLFPGTP